MQRRRFLSGASGTALALGLGPPTGVAAWLAHRASEPVGAPGSEAFPPEILGLGSELDALAGRIADLPEDRALETLAGALRGGLPVTACAAAVFRAAARDGSFHHVLFVIHPALELGRALGPEELKLAVFWTLTYMKYWQRRHPASKLGLRPVLTGRIAGAGNARRELALAMKQMDREKAEIALLSLAAGSGVQAAMDELWHYAARDWTFIGHRAIGVANARAALQTMGWEHAGAALRYLVEFMFYFDAENGDRQCYPANRERAMQHAARLPADWRKAVHPREATVALVDAIRSEKVEAACATAMKMLHRKEASAVNAWDAVHLAAAEVMVRKVPHRSVGGYPLHAVTATNALRTAYESVGTDEERLFTLLQAVGWVAEFARACNAQGGHREIRIDLSTGAAAAGSTATVAAAAAGARKGALAEEESAAQVLAALGKGSGLHKEPPAAPETHDAAARALLAHARAFPGARVYMQRSLALMLRKIRDNPHVFKYPVALYEDHFRVSPEWRPLLLSAAAYYLPSPSNPDSQQYLLVRDLLQA